MDTISESCSNSLRDVEILGLVPYAKGAAKLLSLRTGCSSDDLMQAGICKGLKNWGKIEGDGREFKAKAIIKSGMYDHLRWWFGGGIDPTDPDDRIEVAAPEEVADPLMVKVVQETISGLPGKSGDIITDHFFNDKDPNDLEYTTGKYANRVIAKFVEVMQEKLGVEKVSSRYSFDSISVISPTGEEFTGSLSEICQAHNLDYGSVRRMAVGGSKSVKGWRLK